MAKEHPCNENCKYQREGLCTLERADLVSPVHGATCWEYIFDDETVVTISGAEGLTAPVVLQACTKVSFVGIPRSSYVRPRRSG